MGVRAVRAGGGAEQLVRVAGVAAAVHVLDLHHVVGGADRAGGDVHPAVLAFAEAAVLFHARRRGGGEVVPYDFRKPIQLSREHQRILQLGFDGFVRQATTVFTSALRSVCSVTMRTIDQRSYAEYVDCTLALEDARVEMNRFFAEFPFAITPAALGPAPAGLESTGDPVMNRPWTGLHTPAITVPMPVDGLPMGMQITAAPGQDRALLEIAVAAESAFALHSATL